MKCDLLVLGGGPGGYAAAFRAADLGLTTILVEANMSLGGVCLNAGCIPSKALLNATQHMEAALALDTCGISFAPPEIDLPRLSAWKDSVIVELGRGLTTLAKGRAVRLVQGYGRFLDPHRLTVVKSAASPPDQADEVEVGFDFCVIAAGSRPRRLAVFPEDARILDSTGALALPAVPDRLLIVGGGAIGLELATIYSALGAHIDLVEMQGGLLPECDADLTGVWMARNRHRFDHLMLGKSVDSAEARSDGIYVSFAGADAPEAQRYDMIIEAAGRLPNGLELAADRAGVHVTDDGFIPIDDRLQTNLPHIFAVGDVAGPPMLAHRATHQGHVAAEIVAGYERRFERAVIPSVIYTQPEIAWAGLSEREVRASHRPCHIGVFPWSASGRAQASRSGGGLTKLVFDGAAGRLLGGGVVGPHAGELIAEITLAIEMGATAEDLASTIHPHPTFSETVEHAAANAEGTCTDLPRPAGMLNDRQR